MIKTLILTTLTTLSLATPAMAAPRAQDHLCQVRWENGGRVESTYLAPCKVWFSKKGATAISYPMGNSMSSLALGFMGTERGDQNKECLVMESGRKLVVCPKGQFRF